MSLTDDRFSQENRILELNTNNCSLCCFCERVQTFNLTSAMIFLSCRIQRNLAHQILALAFKMFMAASAALCFASFLLVPSPELRLRKKCLYVLWKCEACRDIWIIQRSHYSSSIHTYTKVIHIYTMYCNKIFTTRNSYLKNPQF